MYLNFKFALILLSFKLTLCKKYLKDNYLIETDGMTKTTPSSKLFRSYRRYADGESFLNPSQNNFQFSYSKGKVSCGYHRAKECSECPLNPKNPSINYGRVWCNGACKWSYGRCIPKGIIRLPCRM